MAAQRAPAGLGAKGKALWRTVTAGLRLRADELEILAAACRTADQIADLEAAIDKTLVAGSRGQLVVHPAIPELRQQRQLLASLLGRLDLPEDRSGIGSEWDGLTSSQRARKAARARWSPDLRAVA